MHCMLCMLTLLILVFVAFTQACIQSNGTYVEGVKSVLCIQGPLHERRLVVAISPVGLVAHQSKEATLLTFCDLSTTRVIAGKIDSQSLILKN